MKKIIFALLALGVLSLSSFSVYAAPTITRTMSGGFLWWYNYVYQTNDNGGNITLNCSGAGTTRCRPISPSSAVSQQIIGYMDNSDAIISQAVQAQQFSGTINCPDIQYVDVWNVSDDESTLTETWYTYSEANQLGIQY